MKCHNCGKEIANDSQFCEYCGVKICYETDSSADKPKIKWGQLVFGIIAVIGGGYFMLRSGGWIGLLMVLVIVGIIGFAAYKSKK